jgi:hypothetical protein
VLSEEVPVRPEKFSASHLSPEWLKAIREAQNRPPGDHGGPIQRVVRSQDDTSLPYEHSRELQTLIARLKRERAMRGLSLGDVARLTQQARSALSRLESGQYANPTLHTLYRYARALGWDITLSARPRADLDVSGEVARK